MDRFLIQIYHDSDLFACTKVVETFLQTGSHYLAQADWGCMDDEHAAWMIVEAGSKEEARQIVPPPYRKEAQIFKLNKFSLEQLEEILSRHRKTSGES